jgi:3-hydroxy-3-methylglutaryl CoA synthase
MSGITGYGAYVPRLRLSRKAVAQSNSWFAPQFAAKAKGTRSMANWDEDCVTMAVAAARDCLGSHEERSRLRSLYLASSTLPFADRLNAGIISEALTLSDRVDAMDISGSQRAALSALATALARVDAQGGDALVLAADMRNSLAASAQELDYGDGGAALCVGSENVIAEYLGGGTVSVDFVDHFRLSGDDVDYQWEERWIRDEGIGKLMPRAIAAALQSANLSADSIDHFIFPSTIPKVDAQLAKSCGIRAAALTDNLAAAIGDTGVAHAMLMLAGVLETARPGQVILVSQFGSGAQALLFRVTETIAAFRPRTGLSGWLARGVEETSYTKFLAFKRQLALDRGMRGEQDKKTALSTLYRHKSAILGLVGGRCEVTGEVHYPPSRISYTPGAPALDTQTPYKLAERQATVLSWSAEYLSYYPAPPQFYGQIDFDGGGRLLMEFTDVARGEVDTGTRMQMVFRVKDFDEKRGFIRYFWKATPVRTPATNAAPGAVATAAGAAATARGIAASAPAPAKE